VRILHPIERKEEERLARVACSQQIFKRQWTKRMRDGDRSLVLVSLREASQRVPRLHASGDVAILGKTQERIETGVAALAGEDHVFDLALPGAEGLFDGMQAEQNIHGTSLMGERVVEGEAKDDSQDDGSGDAEPERQHPRRVVRNLLDFSHGEEKSHEEEKAEVVGERPFERRAQK